MDFAASSVRLSASTVLMSGFGAPARTTAPMRARKFSSTGCNQLAVRDQAIERFGVDDYDVHRLTARNPVGDGLRPITHRRAADRFDLVSGRALELRDQVIEGIGEAGGEHHFELCGGDTPCSD